MTRLAESTTVVVEKKQEISLAKTRKVPTGRKTLRREIAGREKGQNLLGSGAYLKFPIAVTHVGGQRTLSPPARILPNHTATP